MSERLMLVRPAKMNGLYVEKPEVWEVLTPDLRAQEFEGTYVECVQYLRSQCATGSCEE